MSTLAFSPTGHAAADEAPETFSWGDATQRNAYFALMGLVGLLLYSFWDTLQKTSEFWKDDQYSHGFIIPLIALYLLWSRRPNPAAQEPPEGVAEETFAGLMPASTFYKFACGVPAVAAIGGWWLGSELLQGIGLAATCVAGLAYVFLGQPFPRVTAAERWAGLGLLLLAYAARVIAGTGWYMAPASQVAFVVALVGVFVLVGGKNVFWWAGPAVLFLLFMFPLPTVIEDQLLVFLQKLAAIAAEFVLTILGQPVIREGNNITIDGLKNPLAVAEACSGLRMVTIFGAMSLALMLITKRPWWDRMTILLSAIPIALVCNVTRIVVTALLYRAFPDNDTLQQLVHDFAGYGMILLAIGLLYLLERVLSILTVEEESLDLGASTFGGGPTVASTQG